MARTTRVRRILLLAGILPALTALVFSVLVAVMLNHQSAGRDAFADDDFAAAVAGFDDAGDLNPFQDWVSAFDAGAARHAAGEYDDAIDLYELALETVPTSEECTVRINLALVHEVLGDESADGDTIEDGKNAIASWEAGLEVLAGGECPESSGRGKEQTADAVAVKERLEKKIEDAQSKKDQQQKKQKNKQGKKKQDKKQDQPGEEKTPQERELEKRNEKGERSREKAEQRRESEGGGVEPNW